MSALDQIAQKAQARDVFTFYHAGHGSVVDGRFYFVTHDCARLYEEKSLQELAISAEQIQLKLRSIKALKQLVIIISLDKVRIDNLSCNAY